MNNYVRYLYIHTNLCFLGVCLICRKKIEYNLYLTLIIPSLFYMNWSFWNGSAKSR